MPDWDQVFWNPPYEPPPSDEEFLLKVDGQNYELLFRAAKAVKGVPGLSLEIGLRRGGGSQIMMMGFEKTGQKRTHIALDPYGQLPYHNDNPIYKERPGYSENDYSSEMRRETMAEIHAWMLKHPTIDFLYLPLEDTEFFKRFSDGVPLYDNHQRLLENRYALVYFDGPHTLEATLREVEFFRGRSSVGTIFVFDDIDGYEIKKHKFYDHNEVARKLLTSVWTIHETSPTKIAYRKTI